MTSDAAVGRTVVTVADEGLPLVHRAGRVLALAGGIGLVAQLLFFDVGLGINFPVALGLLLAGGWLLRRSRPRVSDVWLAPAAMLLAAFVAVRADPTLLALDVLGSLTLAGAALASFGGRSIMARSMAGLAALVLALAGWALGGAVPAIVAARRQLPSGGAIARRARPALPVLRGVALAIPVVLLFVALFSAADAVFARVMDDLFGVEVDLGDAAWRLALAAVFAWLAAGGLALAASAPPTAAPPRVGRATRWRLGTTELVTVLLAVDGVFLLFVGLQAAYLFGGLDTLAAIGLTYAEYARRGFVELVVVAVLAGALVIAADRLSRERSGTLVAACIGLTLLTGVVLISATMRLRIYQEAYGWTELRLYVLATIAWLALGLIGLAAGLLIDRVRSIGHGMLVAAVGVGLVLNVIGPVRFITEQNVARVMEPSLVPSDGSTGLDIGYVASLGDDAIPALVRALSAVDGRELDQLRWELGFRLEEMRNQPGLSAWQAWNLGRESARDALATADANGQLRQATRSPSR